MDIQQDLQLNTIKVIVARHDPLQLIAQGAPISEYDDIAILINSLISPSMTVQHLSDSIYNLFLNTFYNDSDLIGMESIYTELAKEILDTLK